MDVIEDMYGDEGCCPKCGSEALEWDDGIRDQEGEFTITYPYECTKCGTRGGDTYDLMHLYNRRYD